MIEKLVVANYAFSGSGTQIGWQNLRFKIMQMLFARAREEQVRLIDFIESRKFSAGECFSAKRRALYQILSFTFAFNLGSTISSSKAW